MALSQEEKKDLFEEFKRELMEAQKVYVELCREGVELPQYANIGDAGMDIRAAVETLILPGETAIIPTGLRMAIPTGYELQVRPRSGLSLKTPLRIANTPGTIDSGYRDEVGIIVQNTSARYDNKDKNGKAIMNPEDEGHLLGFESIAVDPYCVDDKGNKQGKYLIKVGDRIAQVVLARFETISFEQVSDVKVLGLNRGGGFGHTGTK